MKRLILHIGTRKTGTTSIQRSFAASEKYLEKNKIYFLGPNLGYRFYPLFLENPRKCFYFQMNNIDSKAKEKAELRAYEEKILDKLNLIKDGTTVISEEDILLISNSKIQNLKKFLEEYYDEITIIIYLREPYSYLKSHLLQDIKVGTKNFEELDSIQYHSFAPIIRDFIDCFGREKFIFRPFDRKAFINGDLVDDFIISSGIEDINLKKITKVNSNESLGNNGLLLLSEINKRYPLFKNGKSNPDRGGGDYLRIFESVKDSKIKFDISVSEDCLEIVNSEIEYYNSLLPFDYNFKKLENNTNIDSFPRDKDLSIEFIVDLINEYNKYNEKLLKIDETNGILKERNSPSRQSIEQDDRTSLGKPRNFSDMRNVYSCKLNSYECFFASKDIEETLVNNKGLKIVANGCDPNLIVGDFGWQDTVLGDMWIKIVLTSPQVTELELFYSLVSNTNEKQKFSEMYKETYPLKKGVNEVYLYISAPNKIEKLRLDPGKVKGEYIINEFEIRT